ncbi:MAG: carbohydrate kinase family protein [Candidatus Hodarchaeales archaeon]|jgi:sugar/nucleoside kinase (ribokinase family)
MSSNELIKYKEKLKALEVTVLPDFYFDILVNPNMPYEKLMQKIESTFARGGGNLLGPEVSFVGGGNGGNVAKTLSGLGVPTTFISETSLLGKQLIEFYFHPLGLKTQLTTGGSLSSSVIFEIQSETGTNNVMLSGAGSLADFGADKLTNEQWNTIMKSDVVAITNAQNLVMEDLVETILSKIPKSVSVSIDFSDLTPHIHRLGGIKERILEHTNPPEIIVGNETEFCLLVKESLNNPEKAIKTLSSSYPSILFGLHMAERSMIWKNSEKLADESCFNVKVQKTTGAGDNWHAGFITGWKLGFSMKQTAEFANAVAAYQISTGNVGSLNEIMSFLNSTTKYS